MYQFVEINQKEYKNYTHRTLSMKKEKPAFYIGIFMKEKLVACLLIFLKKEEETYFYIPYGIETMQPNKKLESFIKKNLVLFARKKQVFKIKLGETKENDISNFHYQKEENFYIPLKKEQEITYPSYFKIQELTSTEEIRVLEQEHGTTRGKAQKLYIIELDILTYLTNPLSLEEKNLMEEIRRELGDYLLLESIGISFLSEKEATILFQENYSTLLENKRKNILWVIVQNQLKKEGYEKIYIPLSLKDSLSLDSTKGSRIPFLFKNLIYQKRRD